MDADAKGCTLYGVMLDYTSHSLHGSLNAFFFFNLYETFHQLHFLCLQFIGCVQ